MQQYIIDVVYERVMCFKDWIETNFCKFLIGLIYTKDCFEAIRDLWRNILLQNYA